MGFIKGLIFSIILLLCYDAEAFAAYQYVVRYEVANKIVSTQYIVEGEDAQEPEAPTVEGKIFKCWSNDGKNVKRNMTIKAIFQRETSADTANGNDNDTNTSEQLVDTSGQDAASALISSSKNSGVDYGGDNTTKDDTKPENEGDLPPIFSTDNTERSIEEVEGGGKKTSEASNSNQDKQEDKQEDNGEIETEPFNNQEKDNKEVNKKDKEVVKEVSNDNFNSILIIGIITALTVGGILLYVKVQ